jgi:ABC-2 type transport system ATP-binding protein
MLLGLARPSSGKATVAGHPPGAPDGMRRVGSLVEVEQICDRVGVIHRGRLIAEGSRPASPDHPPGRAAVGEVDGRFALEVDPRRAGEINAALVSDGLVVSELRARERFREETFLRLTRGASP